jgi:hypothetical protein
VNLGETLETHLAGKTTEKRQNFDHSTPPAGAENLHFTLNGETRRAPGRPVAHAQMAWKDTDKFCSTLCIPFDETTAEQHLRHHLQDWRLRRTPKLLTLKFHCIWTRRFFFLIFNFSFCFILFIYIYIFLSFTYFLCLFLSLFFLFFIFNPLSVSLMPVQLTVD